MECLNLFLNIDNRMEGGMWLYSHIQNMFDSYMFIPAIKMNYIEKSTLLENLDNRIFDLEDSVSEKDIDDAVGNLSKIEISENDWIRIPLDGCNRKELIGKLHELGFSNFVIPKCWGYEDFKIVYSEVKSIDKKAKFIFLIENPKAYVDLEKILSIYSTDIYGVSLGLHDFSFESGMRNDYMFLRDIRINIMLISRAYFVKPLDVVSMHLQNRVSLEKEILDGFKCGYRGKILIHPYQLEVLQSVEFYSSEEIKEYEGVLKYYYENLKNTDVVFSYNGRVYEKMHMREIDKIVKWGNEFYGTDR